MVLIHYDRTWTLGLCSFYLFFNMVVVKSLSTNKRKELFFVSDDKVFQKQYRFEDFFWTGSGDGPVLEMLFNDTQAELSSIEASTVETWRTTTVFHTTTILFATVYPNSEGCIQDDCQPQITTVQTGSTDFSLPTFPLFKVSNVLPSPTQDAHLTKSINLPKDFFDQKKVEVDTNTYTTVLPSPEVSSAKPTIFSKSGGDGFPFSQTDLEVLDVPTVFPQTTFDQKYWVLTVLRNDNYSEKIDINATENKLTSLYKKVFNRRQEKHFGEDNFQKERKISKPLKVQILNMTQERNKLNLIYYITVGGKPVPAMTAANDMRLMTASEVIAELGYPILTKAEPYIKNVVPMGARVKGRTRDTWLFIGCVIAAVLLLIILAALFALGLSKKRTKRSAAKGMINKQQIFEEEGSSNLAFEGETDIKTNSFSKRSYNDQNKALGESSGTIVKFSERERRGSTTSSGCSGSSEASLVRLRHQQKRKERKKEEREDKPKPKPRTRMRRIESSDCGKEYITQGSAHSVSHVGRKNTFEERNTEEYDDLEYSPRLTKSPTSYLSMPSVRAFPRGTKIPESLNKILEPTSICHLDADSDSPCEYPHCSQERHVEVDVQQVCEKRNKYIKKKTLTRHASLEGDDPGFIGPVVWERHCQKINEVSAESLNVEETEVNVNVGRMRKRFNELLDDALSMFGSRNVSPEGSDVVSARQPDNRVHSAVVRPAGLPVEDTSSSRPKTTGSKRPQSSIIFGPRGAWETPSCSTLPRPVSAGAQRTLSPTIDKNFIYLSSELTPSDPAIPLIIAIKNELEKFKDTSSNNE